jgi:hypothetical protein
MVKPAVNQIETHPFFQRIAEQELMRGLGIRANPGGHFSSPILSSARLQRLTTSPSAKSSFDG